MRWGLSYGICTTQSCLEQVIQPTVMAIIASKDLYTRSRSNIYEYECLFSINSLTAWIMLAEY